ncbi:ABC transporter permease [Spirillospora sp. NPDC049024]
MSIDTLAQRGRTTTGARGRLAANGWLAFAIRRSARIVVALGVLLALTFFMIHLVPGDPVRSSLPMGATAEMIKAKRHELGLDQPLPQQFAMYLGDVVHGRLGHSVATGESVSSVLSHRLLPTLQIAFLAFAVILVIALPLGFSIAVLTRGGRRRWLDDLFTFVTGLVGAIPSFLTSVGLIFVFAVTLRYLPAAGQRGPASYLLPVLSLSLGLAGHLARIVRVETLAVLDLDYMRTARSKRTGVVHMYARHALPNILTSVLTISGMMLPGLIGGTVLVENVFAWPGMGTALVQSILAKDYQVVQAIALLLGSFVLISNLLVDIALSVVDPRSAIRGA